MGFVKDIWDERNSQSSSDGGSAARSPNSGPDSEPDDDLRGQP